MCFVSFFLDLEALTKLVAVGNLMTYAFVHSAVIALRFRPSGSTERLSSEKWAWGYFVIAFLFSLSIGYSWHIIFTILFGILTLGFII